MEVVSDKLDVIINQLSILQEIVTKVRLEYQKPSPQFSKDTENRRLIDSFIRPRGLYPSRLVARVTPSDTVKARWLPGFEEIAADFSTRPFLHSDPYSAISTKSHRATHSEAHQRFGSGQTTMGDAAFFKERTPIPADRRPKFRDFKRLGFDPLRQGTATTFGEGGFAWLASSLASF